MIRNTFCHLQGVGIGTEETFWNCGLHSWDQVLQASDDDLRRLTWKDLRQPIQRSQTELERGNPNYFAENLPANQHWRIFPSFRDSIAYVDIETTGLDYNSKITTIALYDGQSIYHYINGKNLPDFQQRIQQYKVIVTYNGKCFDVPFLERFFRFHIDQVHIDLRYLLKSLGYTGGLKGCEAKLGIARGELEGIDGLFAVYLWHDYERNRNEKALETLLAYNVEDVINLEQLLTIAYNKKLEKTPFYKSNNVKLPEGKPNPFKVHAKTVRSIKERLYYAW
jgi:uncharacterized protein YprB with RNaseH-like and TPR domain